MKIYEVFDQLESGHSHFFANKKEAKEFVKGLRDKPEIEVRNVKKKDEIIWLLNYAAEQAA